MNAVDPRVPFGSGDRDPLSWTAESDQASAYFGTSVSSAGDVNGDGYGDVVVGAPNGKAYLYLGSASGLDATAAWTAESDQFAAFLQYGDFVSSAGDVNGDGYGDVVMGAYDEGRAYLCLGSASGLDATAAWTAESDQADAWFGKSVSTAGDVNDDGYGDVVVGAVNYDNGESAEGRAYLYLGSASGLGTSAAWTAESDQDSAWFGYSVSSVGDVNSDGYGDVVVGAPYYDDEPCCNGGRAYLYLGGILDPDLDGVPAESDLCPHVADPGQEDVDGDGVGDACVPLVLTVGEVSVSGGLSVQVDDAVPGETVSVLRRHGPPRIRPCNPRCAGMCLDVGQGTQRWDIVADADGHANLVGGVLTAPVVEGTTVTVQAAAVRDPGGVKSDPVETTVVP